MVNSFTKFYNYSRYYPPLPSTRNPQPSNSAEVGTCALMPLVFPQADGAAASPLNARRAKTLTWQLTSIPASSSTWTTALWPLRAARWSGVCFRVLQLIRFGCAVMIIFTTLSRPYRAAKSNGVSSLLFLIVGSVSSSRRTATTSECPYWAAQCRAVSFSLFCSGQR